MDCFSGCLISSASIQKLFCGFYSAFKCSFDEFVGEKLVSPFYSSAIFKPTNYFICFLIRGWDRILVDAWSCDSDIGSSMFFQGTIR